jgi:hypothetical protein
MSNLEPTDQHSLDAAIAQAQKSAVEGGIPIGATPPFPVEGGALFDMLGWLFIRLVPSVG